jgi:hypothetical protein
MLTKELRSEAAQKISWFKTRAGGMMTEMMINEIEAQFIEMSQGGDGTCTMQGDIRENHYKGKPDAFFQHVCDIMEWNWRS